MLILWLLQWLPAKARQRNNVANWVLDLKVPVIAGQVNLSDSPELAT